MNIDWSKAPEGATHRDTKYGEEAFWYKFDFQTDTAAYCPPAESQWIASGKASDYNDGSLDSMVSRPSADCQKSKACDVMFGVILNMPEGNRHNRSDICEALYDAGYRKFEIVEEDV